MKASTKTLWKSNEKTVKTDITILITGEGQGKGEKLYYAETCKCKYVAGEGDAEVTEDEGRCLLIDGSPT